MTYATWHGRLDVELFDGMKKQFNV